MLKTESSWMSKLVLGSGLIVALLALPPRAEARDKESCKQAWSRAVQSYLTQNRKAGPDGTIAKTMDEEELKAQAWMNIFGPACDMEAQGDKSGARVDAALIGVRTLVKLDPRGCARFLEHYMGASRSQDICSVARSASDADLKQQLGSSLPAKK